MANLKGYVWTVVSTDAIPFVVWPFPTNSQLPGVGAGKNQASPFSIYQFQWISPSAVAGDQVVVKDMLGNIIWQNTATGANWDTFPVRFNDKQPVSGLQVTTLSSGTLFISIA